MTPAPSADSGPADQAAPIASPDAGNRRVCIISLTAVVQEPRVLRQIRTFLEKGWQVTVVGYGHGRPIPETWHFVEADLAKDSDGRPAARETRRIRHMILSDPLAAARRISEIAAAHAKQAMPKMRIRLRPFHTRKRSWSWPRARKHFYRDQSMRLLRDRLLATVPPCDLVVAHDYFTYVIADEVARHHGAKLCIDCHEYALQQYDYENSTDLAARNYWFSIKRPYVDALQRHYFERADVVSTVCGGIADLLTADYALARRPAVIRSTPFFEPMPFRPCGKAIEIVYHGLITPTRNLDVALRALALCREEFRLTMRGPADTGYDQELLELAERLGVAHRFTIAPLVPFAALVASANQADIGYFAFDVFSNQRKYTLPNKFFEYIMSGLALVVMDVPELSKIVNEYRNGTLVDEFTPERIANFINGMDRAGIEQMKQNSLMAARTLCWESEQNILIESYGIS